MAVSDPVEAAARSRPAEGAGPAAAAPQRRWLPILALSLLMAGAGYVAAAYLLGPLWGPEAASAVADPAAGRGEGQIIRFENIIVNPSGTMGSRYLNVTVGFEVHDPKTAQMVEQNKPRIKDALITHLSSRSIDDLTNPNGREAIREAIRELVNAAIAPHQLSAVYFLDFVLQ